MGLVLTDTTVVRNPRTTAVVTLHKGTTLPKWARDHVGDHLVAGGADTAGGKATNKNPASTASGQAPETSDGDVVVVPTTDSDPTVLAEPPRAGRGSGLEAWTAYAQSLGLEVPDEAGRDEVIELVVEYREQKS